MVTSILKRNKGITLVALVITIVVIIILAMITVNFLFGENGLITKAQEAKKMSAIEEVREKLEMATGTAIIDGKGKTTIGDYFELIESEGIIGNKDSDTLDNGDGTYDVTTNEGFIFQVMPVPEKDNTDDILIDYIGETNGPRIKNVTATTTTNSATIEVEAVNAENATYKYEYKKEGEDSWQTVEGENGSTCTINNLEENVIYNIRVTVEVASGGNKGTATREINVRTGEMPTGAITFEQAIWQGDGTASVVVHSSQEGYTIQYQIVATGSVTDPEELEEANWKPVGNGEQITGIQHNQTVYARLWDGHNGSSYASADIKDTEVPQDATISLSSTNVTAGTNVTATVTHRDNESGPEIAQCRYVWNTTSGKIGTDENSYTGGAFSSNGQQISTTLNTVGTYYLHVLTVDKAGNKCETVSSEVAVKEDPNKIENKLKEGNYVNYVDANGVTRKCVVLYDSSSSYGIEIITMNILSSVELGNGTGNIQSDNEMYFNTAMNSYNNAITTLNSKANEYNNSNYSTRARSVGSVPNNINSQSSMYTSSDSWFAKYNNKFRNTDNNYLTDWNKMKELGIENLNNAYWLASRVINATSYDCHFSMRSIDSRGNLDYEYMNYAHRLNSTHAYSTTCGLRPVFKLKPGIKVTGGAGTSSSPYTLGI